MKKFFATFVFAAAVMLISFSPRAFAEVNVKFDDVYFDLEQNEIVLHSTVFNTIDRPVHLNKFDVRQLKIYDADKNLLWEGSVTFDNLNVPLDANGSVKMTFTISKTTPPNYTGTIYPEDDSMVYWTED